MFVKIGELQEVGWDNLALTVLIPILGNAIESDVLPEPITVALSLKSLPFNCQR